MALDESLIGAASEPVTFEVERGAIRKFADAIGDTTPAYQQGDIAPPTFPTTFRVNVPGFDVDLSRRLHGEEEYEYFRPIRAGDKITVVRKVVDVYHRQGRLGHMTFVKLEMDGRDPQGELVFKGRSTIIVR